MAFSGGSGNKPFSPFTVAAPQPGQPAVGFPQQTASFSFGTGAPTGSTGFNFGNVAAAAPSASAPQLSFTAATPAATSSSLFSFGGTAPPVASAAGTAPAPLNFSGFSNPSVPSINTATSLTGALGASNPPQLSFGAPAAGIQPLTTLTTSATPISFTSAPPATAANTVQPTFGVPAATQAVATPTLVAPSAAPTAAAAPAQPGFSFGVGSASVSVTNPIKPITTTTASSAPGGMAPAGTATPATVGGSGDAASTSASQLTTTTTTTQSNAAVSQMNFRQLQEAINKWMLDLQEQEKVFLDQATKVNAWDRTLIANGDKIAKLNESITKVKNDHNRLEHALDYLKTQQQEFEAFLEPLEAGLPVNIPVEPEREHLYSLTENVDTQLQQMAEDLKEVIRHINESNKTVDKNDPISQILRILNEHTDALQWVEDNANQVRRSLEDVSKQHQMAKKEHERSLRQMFK